VAHEERRGLVARFVAKNERQGFAGVLQIVRKARVVDVRRRTVPARFPGIHAVRRAERCTLRRPRPRAAADAVEEQYRGAVRETLDMHGTAGR
jgi:hypothetical protein